MDEADIDTTEMGRVRVCAAPGVHRGVRRTAAAGALLADRAAPLVVVGDAVDLSLLFALASLRGTWAKMTAGPSARAAAAAVPRGVHADDAARDAAVAGVARNEVCYYRCIARARSAAVRESLVVPSLDKLLQVSLPACTRVCAGTPWDARAPLCAQPGKRGLRVSDAEDDVGAAAAARGAAVLVVCGATAGAAMRVRDIVAAAAGAGAAHIVLAIVLAEPHVAAYGLAGDIVPEGWLLDGADINAVQELVARGYVAGGGASYHDDAYDTHAALVLRRADAK